MSPVISDTSPINYLMLIGRIDLIRKLFGTVIIPTQVLRELSHPRAPDPVRRWSLDLPEWVEVASAKNLDASLNLGAGESEAISLAVERECSIIIMDDLEGRVAAQARGINPVGTLNILELAAETRLVDFEEAVTALLATNFRIHPELVGVARSRLTALGITPGPSH